MKENNTLTPYFYKMPVMKVSLLALGTFGFYLTYWYFLQYAQSNKSDNHPFKDFIKSVFFVGWSFSLHQKIQKLIHQNRPAANTPFDLFFVLKFIIPVAVGFFAYITNFEQNYCIGLTFVTWLGTEALYAGELQKIINRHHGRNGVTATNAWEILAPFHLVVIMVGLTSLFSILFFNNALTEFWLTLGK